MKKLIVVLLIMQVVLSLTACTQQESGSESDPDSTENVQIGNPWVDCATLEDASRLAGFDIAIPGKIEGYPNKVIQVMERSMIQVMYYDSDPEAEDSSMVMVRKGLGSDDISGDYNEYSEKETMNIHGVDVQLRGDSGMIYSAIWTRDGYSYAINADKGLNRDTFAEAIEEMVTVVG